MKRTILTIVPMALLVTGCFSKESKGIAKSEPANTTVKMDFFAKPLPEIPLPNDIATRVDYTAATGMRINASMLAPTGWERKTRELIDNLDGWSVLMPISIPFTGPLDIDSILAGHRDMEYDADNDVIYLINVDTRSPKYGTLYPLDVGNGSYPVTLEDRDVYGKNDPRVETTSLMFEEYAEDINGNGVLDPGEDTDADGVLDEPNYLPGHNPAWDDLAGRADALMTFYERQTNTLIVRPLEPLDERTTYAVVVTKRIKDADGAPVGSPFEWINHTAQTQALSHLGEVLPEGLSLSDIAFAFTYTTQTTTQDMVAVRDGLYGHGVQGHIGEMFPAEIETLELMRSEDDVPGLQHPYIVPGEVWLDALVLLNDALLGVKDGSPQADLITDATKYLDYFTVGSYLSPQLFDRYDDDGNLLDYNDQSWPANLHSDPVKLRAEKVYFSVQVPRKEVSVRGEGRPAPVILHAHGHGSSRFEAFLLGPLAVRAGFAVISIDAPSHGIDIPESQQTLAMNLFNGVGIGPAGEALLKDRAWDQNFDGVKDSGKDFWTSYLFHTRDILRQYIVDLMQLTRIMRSFDGVRTWDYDVNNDGQPDIAGDFDGDGIVDIGGDAPIYMMGGSLGGITAMLMGALEPEIAAAAPIVGGGGLGDVGFRSHNGTLPAALLISGVMGPLYVGTLDEESGELVIEAVSADLTKLKDYPLGRVEGVQAGDLMVVENLINGEIGCGYVLENGEVRAAVESDKGDATRMLFYRDAQIIEGSHCEFTGSSTPIAELDSFEESFVYYGREYQPGEPLEAIGYGLGRLRGSPNMRKVGMLGQLVLDRADPAVFARHMLNEPLTYPGTGQTTGTHTLSIPTLGDMNVPVSAAITHARAAGLLPYKVSDRRYGKPLNQVLIDTHTTEGVHNIKRYVDPNTNGGVHIDVENFSQSKDVWQDVVPRLEDPIRMWTDGNDALGGTSAMVIPLTDPQGRHGFFAPYELTDKSRAACQDACTLEGEEDPCQCMQIWEFDPALFILNMVNAYFSTGGKHIITDECMGYDNCTWIGEAPPARAEADLL